tara:strand:- start:3241 stop:3831 length:591 start_codon:yes stop_codon:yes gene_type:complete
MGSLQEQLFTKIASQTLVSLSKDLQKKYEPKKGDRFNYRAITYEIGPPKFTGQGISFEISSKIPESELPDGYKKENFFKEIKKICVKSKKKPLSSDMENIVRETKEQERKERDYVKLTYEYINSELYSDKEIMLEVKELSKNPEKQKIDFMPGVNTLAAHLILAKVQRNLYDFALENVNLLVSANTAVRAELKKKK